MPVVLFDLSWMSFNVFLALIPVGLAYLLRKSKLNLRFFLLFFIWLLFVPNTIYLLTDLIHVSEDLEILSGGYVGVVLGMYSMLVMVGLSTYLLAMYPVITILKKHLHISGTVLLLGLSFVIGIGVILGRIFRFNSWDIVLKPFAIMQTTISILFSPYYLSLCLFFTLISIFFYVLIISNLPKNIRQIFSY